MAVCVNCKTPIVEGRRYCSEACYFLFGKTGRQRRRYEKVVRRLNYQNRIRRDPTPAEIALACSLIQQEWSPDEERKRRGLLPLNSEGTSWLPPVLRPHSVTG